MSNTKTKVSVLLITIRHGGIDWQIRYLAEQTHPVDEFIVVDGFYEERHEEVMTLAEELGVNLIHLREPKLSYITSPNRCKNVNFAIAHARNPLCIFLDDWHVVPNNFVETHVGLYNAGYAGVVRWIHSPFMQPSDYDSFVERVEERRPTMEDARRHFEKERKSHDFTEERGQAWISCHGEDDRLITLTNTVGESARGQIVTDIPVDWWWPNSTGAPLRYLLAVNGFDETFDGGGGCEDVDIATRMSHLGVRYAMDTRITCYHISHVGIRSRPMPQPVCPSHDKAPFTYNEYHKGDPNLIENEQMTTWKVDGVKFCKCKICGWQGLIDSGELLRSKQEKKPTQAPLESLGIPRTNLRELRISLGLPPDGSVE